MCMSRSKHWLGFKLERFQATLHGIVYTMVSTFPTQVFLSFFIRSIDIIPILSTPYYKEEVKNTITCGNVEIDYILYVF